MYGQLMAGGKQFVHCREVVLLSECPLSEVLLYIYLTNLPDPLEYLGLDDRQVFLPALDDGISTAIHVPDGIPFGASHPNIVWVSP